MEGNRGTKRSDPGAADKGHDTSPFKNPIYQPPERAMRATSSSRPTKTKPSWSTKLSDLMIPSNGYQYSPIEKDSIRLLYIEPNSGDEPISCRLETFKESDAPEYKALSYAWGPGLRNHPISIDESAFYVSWDLHRALSRLRVVHKDVCVWVDAICINQEDNKEKSEQVSKMANIYSNAARVMIWLGEENCHTRTTIDYMTSILDPKAPSAQACDDYGILALSRMMTQSYFSRRWTIQEVALANDVSVLCGDHQFRWDDFADAVDITRSRVQDVRVLMQKSPSYSACKGLLDDLESLRPIKLLDTFKDLFLRSGDGTIISPRTSLETLIHEFRGWQTTDKRDVVYSLLGVASLEAHQMTGVPLIVPDYTRTAHEVYTDFVRYCIQVSESSDILLRPWADVERTKWPADLFDHDLQFAVPSWMSGLGSMPYGHPKFNHKDRINGESFLGSPAEKKHNAHNGTKAKVRFGTDDETKTYNGSVFVKGIVLGEVEALSTRMAEGIILKECLEMFPGIAVDDTGAPHDIPQSLWCTLCANYGTDGKRAPRLYRRALLDLFRKSGCLASLDTIELLSTHQPDYVMDFLQRAQSVCWNRRVFQSKKSIGPRWDLVGLAPRLTRLGDKVCILYGCSVPVALRPHQQNNTTAVRWEIIGEAFVHGEMEGQTLSTIPNDELPLLEQEFEIR
ncbi:heterokaryon incompatibility protein-domain-containing protein [Nemania abortiva]|nr:heterokaryon incompatibility protein-domain-containing protein [Nemania abortiva]